jgi:hypothetical protein
VRGEECEGDSFEVAVEFGVDIDFRVTYVYYVSDVSGRPDFKRIFWIMW